MAEATATPASTTTPAAQVPASAPTPDATAKRVERALIVAVLFVPVAAFISLVFVPWFRENIAP